MPNFTLSEIVTIAVVILIVFGPHRLPEMAEKAGQLVRKGRSLVTDLRQEFEGELREVTEPLQELNKEILGIKDEMGTSLTSLTDDVTKAKEEIEAQMAETKKVLEDQVEETSKEIKKVMKEPESAASADEPSATGTESSDPGDDA